MKKTELSFTIGDMFSVAKNTRDVVAGKMLKWALKEVETYKKHADEYSDMMQKNCEDRQREVKYLEDQLSALRQTSVRNLALTPEELALINGPARNKIGAIKSVRDRLNIGLREAKELCDLHDKSVSLSNSR